MASRHIRTGKEFDDVRAEGDVLLHGGQRLRRGSGRLRHQRAYLRQKIAEVIRNSVRRIERRARGVDVRSTDLARFDAAAQHRCVARVGAGVHDGGEARKRKHLLQLLGQFRRGVMRGVRPFILGEVNVIVPETGEDHAVGAIKLLRTGEDLHMFTDGRDLSVLNEDGDAVGSLRVGRDVDFSAQYGEILAMSANGKSDKRQGK